MSYFLNPLGAEFRQGWPIDPTALFVIQANRGNIGTMMSLPGPFDLSVNNTLTVSAAFDIHVPRVQFIDIAVNIAGAVPSATLTQEIVDILNSDPTFSSYFYTFAANWPGNGDVAPFLPQGPPYVVQIYPKAPSQNVTWYVQSCGAESELQFNRLAKIKQLPTYFARDTIANRFAYPDGAAMLVQLDPTVICQAQLIVDAGLAYLVGLTNTSAIVTIPDTSPFTVGDSVVMFDGTTEVSATVSSITPDVSLTLSAPWTGPTETGYLIDILADWELLGGRSSHETFNSMTYDGSGRVTSIVTYFAGSKVADMATKTTYKYTGANTFPDSVCTQPWTLTSGDIVTP